MENILKDKRVKNVCLVLLILIVLYFLVISPIIKFKKMEKELLDAGKRYYEINSTKLPTGTRITKVSLDTLYKKDFIQENMVAPYTSKLCNSENSWVRVSKKNGEYQYDTYLECGLFKSKVDHKGPNIKLKGNEVVTLYQGDKYKDPGIESVVDDTDGKIDIKKVKVTSNVNINRVGTYKITYEVKDSLQNKTVKERIITVKQTLNNIVEKNTDKSNIYKGQHEDNYIMLDGIVFKIYGINSDGTVKIVSNEPLVSMNYDGIDEWENKYFYNLLSDSAKEYIVSSKWCIDNAADPNNYKECKKYSKKKNVGILTVADYNNSKDNKGVPNIMNSTYIWTSSSQNNKNAYASFISDTWMGTNKYKSFKKEELYNVKPVINIKKNSAVISGNGTINSPYVLKGNKNKNKIGSKVSEVKTGTWLKYSGYLWRVIGKEEDGTTKIIMMNTIEKSDGTYRTGYSNNLDYYNPKDRNNIGGKITDDASNYIKTDYLEKKQITVNKYENKVLYGKETTKTDYNLKYIEISVFDLYSPISESLSLSWYREISKNNKYIYVNDPSGTVIKTKYDKEDEYSVRLVGYLNSKVSIKDGEGTRDKPYNIMK